MSNIPIADSGLSVVTPRPGSLRTFYQLPGGTIGQTVHVDGNWIHGGPAFCAVPLSPLASVTHSDGKVIRMYYLDSHYTVQEYCYCEGRGWHQGEIGKLNAKASPNSRLAAIEYGDENGGVHLRIYYRGAGSNVIRELCNDGYWRNGELCLSGVLDGTNIAAVAYNFQQQTQIRVYYQAEELSLKEHCHNNRGWFAGHVFPDKARARCPISALAFGGALQVYWRNPKGEIVVSRTRGLWSPSKVIPGTGPGFQFAILQWEDGKRFRLYYQDYDDFIFEYCSDNGGETWFLGAKLTNHQTVVPEFHDLHPVNISASLIHLPRSPVSGRARDFLEEFNRVAVNPGLGASLEQLKEGVRESATRPAESLVVEDLVAKLICDNQALWNKLLQNDFCQNYMKKQPSTHKKTSEGFKWYMRYEADHGLKATDGTDFGTSLDRVAKRGNYVKEVLETCTITPPNGLGIKDYCVLTTPPTEALIRYINLLQNAADAENWAVAMVAMIPCVQSYHAIAVDLKDHSDHKGQWRISIASQAQRWSYHAPDTPWYKLWVEENVKYKDFAEKQRTFFIQNVDEWKYHYNVANEIFQNACQAEIDLWGTALHPGVA